MKETNKSNKPKGISIIIPVLNEHENIGELVQRIIHTMVLTRYRFEIVFINDHSTDNTRKTIESFAKEYPIRVYNKKGVLGKAQSILEGVSRAKYELICMIDGDLQYPPEAIRLMMKKIEAGNDVVVARRKDLHTSLKRKIASKAFNYVFCKLLHRLNYDVQSGLKLFKKEILERVTIKPFSWSFDLEFLLTARAAGYKLSETDIVFEKRFKGKSKINLVRASLQIATSAVLLKLNTDRIIPFHKNKIETVGQGFHYKTQEFVHYSDLHITETAFKTLHDYQLIFLISVIFLFCAGLIVNWKITLITVTAIITIIYFIDLLFNFYLIYQSFAKSPEIKVSDEEINKVKDWPKYTIFCPLYHEWNVANHFVQAIEKLDYPKDKLQVLLLLEEDDKTTIDHIQKLKLAKYFQTIIVPHSYPKTKPKACNYGLRYMTGEYAVIYDAEDLPDPRQLKKAVVGFQKLGEKTVCMQAKLNYFNKDQNLLTRLFTAEYSLWFDLILTGLQSLNAPIPLGGTSNHFRADKLVELNGWDSFNVTEDCDLGIRLVKRGYQTAIMDSVTLEEANSDLLNWLNQRSRWIKGYIQSYLVHMRNPYALVTNGFKAHFLTFQMIVGGKILALFVNPLMWTTTILYFSMRATLGTAIEEFFPGPILYMGVFSLIFGNFLYMYYYMIACANRKQYSLIKYVYLVPFYWLGMSIAAWKGVIQLIFSPHYWPKTKHGLHIKKLDIVYQLPKEEAASNQLAYFFKKIVSKGKFTASSATLLIAGGVLANGINYLYSAYLSRKISLGEFGLISLVGSFLFVTIIPLDSLASTIIYRTSYFFGKYQVPFRDFWLKVRRKIFYISLLLCAAWVVSTPFLASFFKSDSLLPFMLFAPVWIFNSLMTVDLAYLTGSHSFIALTIITVLVALTKLISTVLIVENELLDFIYAAIPLSILLGSILSYIFVRNLLDKNLSDYSSKLLKFPYPYFYSAVLLKFATVSYITVDLFLAKRFLSPEDAGRYALIALVGKMIFFIGGLFNQFIIPFLSREFGEKKASSRSFPIILSASTISAFTMYVIVGILGHVTAPLLFGEKMYEVVAMLPIYGAGVLAFSIASSIIAYHQVRNNHIFPIATFVLAIVQIIVISTFHNSLTNFVYIVAATGLANLVCILLLHFFRASSVTLSLNFEDFLNLFTRLPNKIEKNKEHLNILIFNWRDTKHVWSGGAEVYIHEIAKRLVNNGHNVTLFCGNDNHCKRYEIVDQVNIIRRGGFYTVYIWAFLYYVFKLRNKFDVIIDSENGVPFFTPLYARKPIIGLVHNVHQEVFRTNLPKVLATIACFMEATLMPMFYNNVQMVTVSQSSKKDMENIGLGKKRPIEIVHPGIDLTKFKPGAKTQYPTVLYLGRLKPYKSIDVLIKAAQKLITHYPNIRITITGFGESRGDLVKLAKHLNIIDYIDFTGKVSDEDKIRLLQQSWVFVQPSSMEGWGISALEAQATGTAVVASDVPGLRDSVKNPHSGFLVKYGNINDFSLKIAEVLSDKKLRNSLEKAAVGWSSNFSWEKSALKFEEFIKKTIQ